MAPFVVKHLHSQLCVKLPVPIKVFTGQTIIITGSNIGLGLEAARHFVRLDALKVILAVRNLAKGQEAAQSIAQSTIRQDVVEVWELNLSSYASVVAFGNRIKSLDRLDVFVANAAKYTWTFSIEEQDESTITVNVVSTMLLGLLALPKLRETSLEHNKETVLTFTGSFMHHLATLPGREVPNIFEALSAGKNVKMNSRYETSKLMQLLLARELASRVTSSTKPGNIVINTMNPGHVRTNIDHEATSLSRLWIDPAHWLLARSTEEGSRALVNGAEGGAATHGQYLHDCKIDKVSSWVSSNEGRKTQQRLWHELATKLSKIEAGIMDSV